MQRIDFQLLLLRSTRQTLFCSINAREVELPIDICDFVTVQKKKKRQDLGFMALWKNTCSIKALFWNAVKCITKCMRASYITPNIQLHTKWKGQRCFLLWFSVSFLITFLTTRAHKLLLRSLPQEIQSPINTHLSLFLFVWPSEKLLKKITKISGSCN